MKRQHTLIVMVEDHPGVLNRVVSLLRRRSFNIDSITVGHSEQPGVSRMTIVVRGTDADIEQAGKQLYKLMEVLKVIDLTDQPVVAHEMMIVKVAAKAYRKVAIYEPGQYIAKLEYQNGSTTYANWTVRDIAPQRRAKNVVMFIGDGMTTNMITGML